MKEQYKTTVRWNESFNETTTKSYLSEQKPHITLIGSDTWSSHMHLDFGDQVLTVKSQALERMETVKLYSGYEDDF